MAAQSTMVSNAGYVDLTPGELYTPGYMVKPVNQRLATITGHGGQQFALCQSYQTAGTVETTADNITGRSCSQLPEHGERSDPRPGCRPF